MKAILMLFVLFPSRVFANHFEQKTEFYREESAKAPYSCRFKGSLSGAGEGNGGQAIGGHARILCTDERPGQHGTIELPVRLTVIGASGDFGKEAQVSLSDAAPLLVKRPMELVGQFTFARSAGKGGVLNVRKHARALSFELALAGKEGARLSRRIAGKTLFVESLRSPEEE
jgi:hypothetical protein